MINDLFREDLKSFKPYEVDKNNYTIRLDANESFLNFSEELKEELINSIGNIFFNRYPDSDSIEICKLYADYAGVNFKNVMAGNGSDELIQIIVNAIIKAGDKVMMLTPDFSVYNIYTKLVGGMPVEFQLNNNFELDVEALITKVNFEEVKLIFISNPNNPTGGVIPEEQLIRIITETKSIVVIDEAYYEFYGETLVDKINIHENLVILRTCSKAIGLAALRLGFLITNKLLMNEFKKVKLTYNVNTVTQSIAAVVLKKPDLIKKNIEFILKEREYLLSELKKIKGITIYPTKANYVLIESRFKDELRKKTLGCGISVRNFSSPRLKNCLRITVGNREENKAFIDSISR